MTFSKQIEIGFRTYFSAIRFIFSQGLWWAFFFPFAINILLFIGGYSLMDAITTDFRDWIINSIGISDKEQLSGFISGFILVLLNVLLFFLFAYIAGYLTLILLSPLFAYLSERTEEIISGNKYPFNFNQLIKDIFRGIFIAIRNLIIQTGWIVLFFIFGFIPVFGWCGPIALFIISAYFYGFSFIDYTSERRKMRIGESVQFVRIHKWLAVANGTVFSFFILIPFVGILFSGFAAIISVVAATLAANEISPARK